MSPINAMLFIVEYNEKFKEYLFVRAVASSHIYYYMECEVDLLAHVYTHIVINNIVN